MTGLWASDTQMAIHWLKMQVKTLSEFDGFCKYMYGSSYVTDTLFDLCVYVLRGLLKASHIYLVSCLKGLVKVKNRCCSLLEGGEKGSVWEGFVFGREFERLSSYRHKESSLRAHSLHTQLSLHTHPASKTHCCYISCLQARHIYSLHISLPSQDTRGYSAIF